MVKKRGQVDELSTPRQDTLATSYHVRSRDCDREGHMTYPNSRWCHKCGWILTDEEAKALDQ